MARSDRRRLVATWSQTLMSLLVGLLVAGPLAATYLLERSQDPLGERELERVPVYVYPEPRDVSGEFTGALGLSWNPGRDVIAPTWSGVVTSVEVGSGASVATGQVLLTVDGVGRIAAATSTPFFRELTSDSEGPDVTMLNALLGTLGYQHGSDHWSRSTSAGVRALQAALGVPVGTAGPRFDPAWVLWIPEEPFSLGAVDAVVGAPVPPQGSAVFVGSSTLARALPVDTEGVPLAVPDGFVFVPQSNLDLALPVSSSGLKAPELRAVELVVEVGQESEVGTFRAATPEEVLAVPTTAVVLGTSGATCVWARSSEDPRPRPHVVTVVSGDVGLTYLARTLGEDLEVLANPADVIPDLSCT